MIYKFIQSELNSFALEQRITMSEDLVKLICKAFESYDTYKQICNSSIIPITINAIKNDVLLNKCS